MHPHPLTLIVPSDRAGAAVIAESEHSDVWKNGIEWNGLIRMEENVMEGNGIFRK
jgi:hypothetical protein